MTLAARLVLGCFAKLPSSAFSRTGGSQLTYLALAAERDRLRVYRRGEQVRRRFGWSGGFASPAADDDLLSFFTATFAPVKFERSAERLAETLLR